MKAFTYERVETPQQAVAAIVRTPGAKFIAGGTNLLDLMKLQIETPTHLVDVNRLGVDKIETTADGGLRVGALVRACENAPGCSRGLSSGCSLVGYLEIRPMGVVGLGDGSWEVGMANLGSVGQREVLGSANDA